MKTKLKLSIIIWLFSSLCTTISAKDLNPAYCNSIPLPTNGWNEKEAKATLIGIPKDCQKLWCGYTFDSSWSSWCNVPITFTPGDITVTTPTIIPDGPNWKAIAPAWPGGAASNTKPGFTAFCLWSPTNSDPKNQDCTVLIYPSNYDCSGDVCKYKLEPNCDNFKACLSTDGNSVNMSGFRHYLGNWFVVYSDDGWANYADVTPTLAPGQDEICLDFRNFKYAGGVKAGATVTTPLTGYLSIIGDSNFGPAKCDHAGGYYKNGIDLTTAPVCTTCVPSVSVNEVTINSITIAPNPAAPTETITIKGEYTADAKVSILSASGSTVGSVIPAVSADAMAVSLSGLNLQAGIYYLRIDSGEKAYSAKLCVK